MTTVYHRPHHQKILKALSAFNEDLLVQAKCFFAGGAAIAMSLGEYRTSVDIDFLCADAQGYRFLRNAVGGNSLGPLLREGAEGIALAREIRTDQSKILTVLDVDGLPRSSDKRLLPSIWSGPCRSSTPPGSTDAMSVCGLGRRLPHEVITNA